MHRVGDSRTSHEHGEELVVGMLDMFARYGRLAVTTRRDNVGALGSGWCCYVGESWGRAGIVDATRLAAGT